jgi:hypothetical protein
MEWPEIRLFTVAIPSAFEAEFYEGFFTVTGLTVTVVWLLNMEV